MKNRSIVELLEVMLEYENRFTKGLCSWAIDLYMIDVINDKEIKLLRDYIKGNRPAWYSSFQSFIAIGTPFYFVPGNLKPRVKWIKKHIKKLKQCQ